MNYFLKIIRWSFLLPIVVYRYCISPLKPACCRFEPTCSAYALEAIKIHGVIYGITLTTWRILRCHPFYKGATYDPVPPKNNKRKYKNI